jgi:hypothetical protein
MHLLVRMMKPFHEASKSLTLRAGIKFDSPRKYAEKGFIGLL